MVLGFVFSTQFSTTMLYFNFLFLLLFSCSLPVLFVLLPIPNWFVAPSALIWCGPPHLGAPLSLIIPAVIVAPYLLQHPAPLYVTLVNSNGHLSCWLNCVPGIFPPLRLTWTARGEIEFLIKGAPDNNACLVDIEQLSNVYNSRVNHIFNMAMLIMLKSFSSYPVMGIRCQCPSC